MFGIDDALMGGIIAGGMSFLGGERRNEAQADQAAAANQFSAQQYATRYQTQVKDMEAAGLNPMLSYAQSPGASPTGQQAQMQDTVSPAVGAFQQQKLNSATVANVEADTVAKRAQAGLIRAQEINQLASADQARSNIGLIEHNVQKIKEEIKNIPVEGDRLRAAVNSLNEQAELARQQGKSQEQVRMQLIATTEKLIVDRQLGELDLKAAETLDNLGRTSKELAPIVQMLKMFLRK